MNTLSSKFKHEAMFTYSISDLKKTTFKILRLLKYYVTKQSYILINDIMSESLIQ